MADCGICFSTDEVADIYELLVNNQHMTIQELGTILANMSGSNKLAELLNDKLLIETTTLDDEIKTKINDEFNALLRDNYPYLVTCLSNVTDLQAPMIDLQNRVTALEESVQDLNQAVINVNADNSNLVKDFLTEAFSQLDVYKADLVSRMPRHYVERDKVIGPLNTIELRYTPTSAGIIDQYNSIYVYNSDGSITSIMDVTPVRLTEKKFKFDVEENLIGKLVTVNYLYIPSDQ